MTWLFFALSGPVLYAISVHFDKYLVERYFKDSNVAVLLVFTAMAGVAALPFIGALQPHVLHVPWKDVSVIALAGLLFMTAMYFYLQALQTEEASVVSPFFQASPLFAYGLGYLVLGERLTGLQLAGGALIVVGAVLISVRFRDAGAFKARLVALMLTCAMALACASLIFKIFAVRDDFWTTMFWTFAGQAAFGVVVLAIPSSRRQFLTLLRENPAAMLTINAVNELVNLAGSLGARFALTLAPLSLVQAVTSTTTLFVFLFGVAITLVAPTLGREDLSWPQLARKGLSAILIVIGVILVVSHTAGAAANGHPQ